jgi:hypothetical protein
MDAQHDWTGPPPVQGDRHDITPDPPQSAGSWPRSRRDCKRWLRFDWDAVQRTRDGVTLDAVGLPPLVNAVAKMPPPPSAEEADQQWLETMQEVHVATAPLLGMIAVQDLYDLPTTLAAGQAWQRLHLWATARGLAAQPLNQPAEMVGRGASSDGRDAWPTLLHSSRAMAGGSQPSCSAWDTRTSRPD